ncbi:MAG: hypothetical protein KA015_02220 [Spirochaetes bacterium]|nr:hypothetical protein [Spirochaetota bacterium]
MKKISILILIIVSASFYSETKEKIDHSFENIIDDKEYTSQEKYTQSYNAIIEVVQNKTAYMFGGNNQRVFMNGYNQDYYLILNDDGKYIYVKGENRRRFVFNRFCWLDVDSNNAVELLLESEHGDILLLHYDNGIVYGDVFPFRGMLNLKKDGSFEVSGGAAVLVVGKLGFSNGKCLFIEFCCCDELDDRKPKYRINCKKSFKIAVQEYLKRQDDKEDAEWF